MKIKNITNYLESIAPLAYQESYDNAGLITGESGWEVNGILTTLDCTEVIVEEAIQKNCNLIVAHHPIVFSGLKKINGKNYVEKTIIKAIKNDIAIYAIHTNLDNVNNGVNAMICEKLGLTGLKTLSPKKNILTKLTTFVPKANKEEVLEALSKAGAGNIGNYSNCSFQLEGTGTFQPNEVAKPHIGKANKLESVEEIRLEVILPSYLEGQVLNALKTAHPYEEVAYYLHNLENKYEQIGSGMTGNLPDPLPAKEFLAYLKEKMDLKVIRHTPLVKDSVKKIAVCGGAGSFLLKKAIGARADIFITGDFKYHEFFDAEDKIIIADVGHFESETYTRDLLKRMLEKEFKNISILVSEVNTNPVGYFY
ncbi:Nif3-like dinuclear metal center hexameric protein [Flexithrix dorotheae]|uniref:Nif3-like dinuclear metal center hexameric protein n=1 Tax=Flexithrix dorotheae TaxID=70993 RepID=UPI00037BBA13|nr:Nif3-like dinuclear metal center hexameric protein [Flexithrix dorotheae]